MSWEGLMMKPCPEYYPSSPQQVLSIFAPWGNYANQTQQHHMHMMMMDLMGACCCVLLLLWLRVPVCACAYERTAGHSISISVH